MHNAHTPKCIQNEYTPSPIVKRFSLEEPGSMSPGPTDIPAPTMTAPVRVSFLYIYIIVNGYRNNNNNNN